MSKITLKDFEGKHYLHGFQPGYEPDGETQNALLWLDNFVYKLKENPDDGYRSYLDEIEIVNTSIKFKLPAIPVIGVPPVDYDVHNYITFIAQANYMPIIQIGTEDYDDWYPTCILRYYPENLYDPTFAYKASKMDKITYNLATKRYEPFGDMVTKQIIKYCLLNL